MIYIFKKFDSKSGFESNRALNMSKQNQQLGDLFLE